MIASLDAEDRTELHCTVRDIESDAKVTNNNLKNCAGGTAILLKPSTDIHKASCSLSATAEPLVCFGAKLYVLGQLMPCYLGDDFIVVLS